MVLFDENRSSERALRKAVELARQYNAELVLIYVYQPPEIAFTDGIVSSVQKQLDNQVRLYVKTWCAKISRQGCNVHGYCVPGKDIRFARNFIAREHADAIVIAVDADGSFGKVFRGSLAQYFEAVTGAHIITA